MADSLIGQDFVPPDVRSKVTGRAKYAEDVHADGMLFCHLLLSPMPHGRVTSIDTTEALKMNGVVAVLDADEVPSVPPPQALRWACQTTVARHLIAHDPTDVARRSRSREP